jgi:hypothetical protein
MRKSFTNLGNINFKNEDIINTINYLASVKFSLNYNVLHYIIELLKINNTQILEYVKLNPHQNNKRIIHINLIS